MDRRDGCWALFGVAEVMEVVLAAPRMCNGECGARV